MDLPNLAQTAQELGSWNPRLETTRGTRARAVPVNGVVGSSTEMSVLVQLHRIYKELADAVRLLRKDCGQEEV